MLLSTSLSLLVVRGLVDVALHIVISTGSTSIGAQRFMDVATLARLASQGGRCLSFSMM